MNRLTEQGIAFLGKTWFTVYKASALVWLVFLGLDERGVHPLTTRLFIVFE